MRQRTSTTSATKLLLDTSCFSPTKTVPKKGSRKKKIEKDYAVGEVQRLHQKCEGARPARAVA